MAHLLSVWLRLPIEWRWWWHCQEVLSKTKKTQFSVCVLANDDNQHDNERVTEWLSAFLSSPSSSLCICLLPLFLSLTLITMCCPLSTDHYTQKSTCHDTNHSSWTVSFVVSFSLARFTLHSIAIILMDISITILAGGCTKALAHCFCHQVVFWLLFLPSVQVTTLSVKKWATTASTTATTLLHQMTWLGFLLLLLRPIPCNGQLALTRRVCRHSSAQTGERSCSLAQFSTSCQTPCPPE